MAVAMGFSVTLGVAVGVDRIGLRTEVGLTGSVGVGSTAAEVVAAVGIVASEQATTAATINEITTNRYLI